MGWIKDKLVQFLAPSFLNKYVGTALRAAFLSGSVWIATQLGNWEISPEVIEQLKQVLSPENADRLAAFVITVTLGAAFADKKRNQAGPTPAGEHVTGALTSPIEAKLPDIQKPDPRVL